ncbi:MAG: succinyldiaminopimelate transaminase [Campylobacterales bacterium]
MKFESYPFEKLAALTKDIAPSAEYSPLKLTIGEPQFDTPQFIRQKLCDTAHTLNKYPKTAGEDELKSAMLGFVHINFGVELKGEELIPTLGTREVLFNFPQFYLFGKSSPVMAYPNPFYQIYEGAAIASKAEVLHLNLRVENGFLPSLEELKEHIKNGKKPDIVILNSPNNPTAAVMSLETLKEWMNAALEYDFLLINDECYNQIYFGTPPPSLLEAAIAVGNESLKNCLVLNSISKRSSAPGLRSGFIAGDATILKEYLKYRTYVGATNGLPMQYAAAVAWNDEEHVMEAREKYRQNFEIASRYLGTPMANATFYIWFAAGNGVEFAANLYRQKNVLVLPGSFLARGFADEYVRIALVESPEKTEEAIKRLRDFL